MRSSGDTFPHTIISQHLQYCQRLWPTGVICKRIGLASHTRPGRDHWPCGKWTESSGLFRFLRHLWLHTVYHIIGPIIAVWCSHMNHQTNFLCTLRPVSVDVSSVILEYEGHEHIDGAKINMVWGHLTGRSSVQIPNAWFNWVDARSHECLAPGSLTLSHTSFTIADVIIPGSRSRWIRGNCLVRGRIRDVRYWAKPAAINLKTILPHFKHEQV